MLCALGQPASAQLTILGATGADNALNASGASYVIDLSQASTNSWDAPPAVAGKGVYDPEKWAVVFKYSSVNIPSGTTVTFKNHGSRAPVVWLMTGNVTINGTVSLDGAAGGAVENPEPGPGGFRGGRGGITAQNVGGSGLGPGGGELGDWGGPGSYATVGTQWGTGAPGGFYGNAQVLPLIGGSGAGGRSGDPGVLFSGGAGGGALLVASQGTILINGNGKLSANGGAGGPVAGGGSGGAIRLVASVINGTGTIMAIGGYGSQTSPSAAVGGNGRIRLEALTPGNSLDTLPRTIAVTAQNPPPIWPDNTIPQVTVVSVGVGTVPADPRSNFGTAGADVTLTNVTTVPIVLQTRNVPTSSATKVRVRVVPRAGDSYSTNATFVSGDQAIATWRAQMPLPNGHAAIQVRVVTP